MRKAICPTARGDTLQGAQFDSDVTQHRHQSRAAVVLGDTKKADFFGHEGLRV